MDIFDYIDRRGDISFKDSPFNEVDNIIFNMLTYINYTDVLPEVFTKSMTIKEVSKSDFTMHYVPDPRLYVLLEKCAASKRYQNVRLTGYVDIFKVKEDCQFCALTFLFDRGSAYVCFRGTDSSVTGLKEDFNMAYKAPVPSQANGVKYLGKLLKNLSWWKRRRQLMLGGHSKGGNVAQYTAIHCPKKERKKISVIWSNDGPGFNDEFFPKEWSVPLIPRMRTFIPAGSIIGRLFDHQEELIIIKSSDPGLMSHDPFTWCVKDDELERELVDSPKSELLDRSFRDWLKHIEVPERKNLIDAIFTVLTDMGITSLFDFRDFKLGQLISGLNAMNQLPSEQKRAVIHSLTQFTRSYSKSNRL